MGTRARRELTALRLTAQGLTAQGIDPRARSTSDTPADIVRRMLAMQAQDFPGAKWSIGLRLPGSTDAAVEASIAAGEIVRSWPMRGTLHFVAPEDLRWMLAISGERQGSWAAKRRGDLGITDRELVRAADVAIDVMTGGRVIRRDLLLAAWQEAGIPTTGQRGYHLLWNLAHSGLLVFGPVDGKQPTFALLDEWIPRSRALENDEALGEFARRYFTSHGPATVRDLAWWASITLGDARKGVAVAGDSIELREFDGAPHYLAAGLSPARPGVHALPGFDEYMLGYQDRSAVLAAEYSDRIVPGNNGVFMPTVVVDGRVVGTWKRAETAKKVRVNVTWFDSQTKPAMTGFERAIQRYGAFLSKPVEFGKSVDLSG